LGLEAGDRNCYSDRNAKRLKESDHMFIFYPAAVWRLFVQATLVMILFTACQPGTLAPSVHETSSAVSEAATPGRLVLSTQTQQQIVLEQGNLQIFAGETLLSEVQVRDNRFSLPRLAVAGPYTYQGQGVIGRLQNEAIPISGSQGMVPTSGSQGGLLPQTFGLKQLQNPQPGQTISFTGQILEDLRQILPQLDLRVAPENITLVVQNSIVNIGSDVKDSVQAVVGNTQGNVNIGNTGAQSSPQPASNQVPIIERIQFQPTGPVRPGESVTLSVEAHDPAGGALQYRWSAERGSLSADRGREISWSAQDSQADWPDRVQIQVRVINAAGAEEQATLTLQVQNPGNETSDQP